jgi:hypothetical protein
MIQIALVIIGLALLIGGIVALTRKEGTKRKTAPGVAVTMIVLGAAVLVFAIVGITYLLGR